MDSSRIIVQHCHSSREFPELHATEENSNHFHCHDESGRDDNGRSKKAIRVLWISLGTCLFFMICEVVGGIWAKSLAIVTDAAHLLTDFASMLISLFSIYIASKPPSQRMSFGFYRAEVLGAFFSVFLIWIVTVVLIVLAIQRMINQDYDINSTVMAITAAIGVVVNLIMGIVLYFGGHSHSHGGLGDSHAHIHPSEIVLKNLAVIRLSIGVLIAALIIFFNKDWAIVDPICTLIFSIIVLCTTMYILRDAAVVLLEGRPSTIDFSNVFTSLKQIKGVRKVHDLRIWALTMDKVAISVHLEVAQPEIAQSVLRETCAMLKQVYGVHESTVQIEGYVPEKDCDRCDVPK
ncbi:hypothetical protein KIN20_008688 [Parelaphostrongylus tenuis]|uniref:Uncharacterized protein n=1 Tax=Parelaphostrongylus tenuis TaxID=148309 RepID=A0AAD5M544_PARTN|nr:hypothetical protein KIN20_008688 [Parelaphostrongylus tenuis]